MSRATAFISTLCDEVIGRVFGWNVIDHVDTDHLDERIFSQAWTYYVDNTVTPPIAADRIIFGIQKWPGVIGKAYTGLPVWMQGQKSPPELLNWQSQELFNVTLTERVIARMNKMAVLGALPLNSNPLGNPPCFVAWLSTPVPPIGTSSDDVRDLLGLVHRTVENGDELTLLEYAPGAISFLAKPTPLDSGANTRFCAVSEEEWSSRLGAGPYPHVMGRAAHLEKVRNRHTPITIAHEAVSIAGNDFIDRSRAQVHLGPVTRKEADDLIADPYFEGFLNRARDRKVIEDFFEDMYRPGSTPP